MTTDLITAARAMIEPLTGYTPKPWKNRGPATASVTTFYVHSQKGSRASVYGRNACADADLMAASPDLRDMVATLADALEAERAKVAAAYEAAATLSEASAERNKTCPSGCRCADGWHIAMRIRSLTPSDAQAALDKMLSEARLEGWRAGRDAAADAMQPALRSMLSRGQAAAAILAMPEPKEASHD